MYDKTAGKLDVGRQVRSGGKLVDEWTFRSPFKGKDAPKLTARISIDKSDKNDICFVAHSDTLPHEIKDTDINRLRQKVDDALRLQHDLLTGVTWEDWLEVEVRGRLYHQEYSKTMESELKIIYRHLKRGVHPSTGDAYVINSNGIALPFPKPKNAGELDGGETEHEFRGMNKRDKEAEYSYLPATPENIAALDELMGRMQTLRANLSAFLRQDTVQKSLADLNSRLPSLPAPL